MNEIKNAPAGTDANKSTQQNYSIEKLINQKVLGKSIAGELVAFEAVGLHLLNFYEENGVLDDKAINYIHGQGEGMLKVVDSMRYLIAKLNKAVNDDAHV